MAGIAAHQVLSLIDGARIRSLLVEAVARYSPSFAEEPALAVFERALASASIPTRRQAVDGDDPAGRSNLIARIGPDPVGLMWVGHVDTVTILDEDHLRPVVRDGVLSGLGSADMKGGCTAVVEALCAVARSGVQLERGITVALVVGEEEYGDGAEALAGEHSAPLVVVGEPTGLATCTEHFGYLECHLTSHGTRAHAALPEHGDNAIHAMLVWLMRILEARDALPGAGSVVLNPREIEGGQALFAVPEHCEADLDVHVPPDVDVTPVRQILESARESAMADHPGCALEVKEMLWAPGYVIDEDAPVLAAIRLACATAGLPYRQAQFRSHSDASILRQAGMQPIVCGPGLLEVAHTENENVSLAEVESAARLYAALMLEACGNPREAGT